MNPDASSLEVLESRYDQVLNDLDVLLSDIEATINSAKPAATIQSPAVPAKSAET